MQAIWRRTAAAGLVWIAACLLLLPAVLPEAGPGDRLALIPLQVLAVVAIVAGLRRQPPRDPWPWRAFAAAGIVLVVATGFEAAQQPAGVAVVGEPSTGGEAWLLLWYPLVLAGLWRLQGGSGGPRDWTSRIDMAVLAVALAVLGWVFVVQPYEQLGALSQVASLARIWAVADLSLLLLALRLALAGDLRRRREAYSLVLLAVVVRLGADVAVGAVTGLQLPTDSGAGRALEMLWWASWLGLVPVALHPASRDLAAPRPATVARAGLGTGRLAALAAAALLVPLLYATEGLHGQAMDDEVAGPLLLLSVTLVLARLWLLVRQLGHSVDTIAELERERGDARLGALVRHSGDVIVLCDRAGTVTWISPSLRRLLGHEPEDALGMPLHRLVHRDDQEQIATALDQLTALGRDQHLSDELRIRHADGSWRQMQVSASNLLDLPEVGALVFVGRDVTERAALEQQLRRQAFTDALTGLANRVLFLDRVEHALAAARRRAESSAVALLFVDLDDFKTVNDSLGHEAGDQLLVAVAQRLGSCVRDGDTAARLGGDEFAVLLENLAAPHEEAEAVASRLLAALADPVPLGGRPVRIAASVGIAVAEGVESAAVLLRNADAAMYTAKAAGKGVAALFRADMHSRALRRLELKAALEEALARDELFLAYQPVVDLASEVPVGAEALLRWEHPSYGAIPPVEFLPLAEESGLIVPIGRWVLREACRQAREWRDTLPGAARLVVSVNVSGRQLSEGLVDDVASALAEAGLPPSALLLELTESVLVGAVADPDAAPGTADAAVAVLHALKELGVRLAVDDFGTGYSSLSYLQRFPVDTLKLDKSFVDALGQADQEERDRARLVRGVLSLASSLGLHTVAEGIEDAAQLDELRTLQCALGQGYLFARPLSPQAFSTLLDPQSAATS